MNVLYDRLRLPSEFGSPVLVLAADPGRSLIQLQLATRSSRERWRRVVERMDVLRAVPRLGWTAVESATPRVFSVADNRHSSLLELGVGELVPAEDATTVWVRKPVLGGFAQQVTVDGQIIRSGRMPTGWILDTCMADAAVIIDDVESDAPILALAQDVFGRADQILGHGLPLGAVGNELVWTNPIDGTVRVTDVQTLRSRILRHPQVGAWDAAGCAFANAQGTRFALRAHLTNSKRDALAIVEVATLSIQLVFVRFLSYAWAPDGMWLAFGDGRRNLTFVQAQTGERAAIAGTRRLVPLAMSVAL